MTKTLTPRYCNEPLQDADGFRARCRQRFGTEHSHHDTTARRAVVNGTASAEPLDYRRENRAQTGEDVA